MKALEKLPSISNVAAGNSVTLQMPVGNVYETLIWQYTGVTSAQIKNVKIELNDKLIAEYKDLAVFEALGAFYKRPDATAGTIMHFNRPEMHDIGQRRFFGLDTNRSQGVVTATIRFDIDAAAAAPVIDVWAIKSNAVEGVPNFLTKVRKFTVPVTAAGTFDIDNLPLPIGAHIGSIHLYKAEADVSDVEVLIDSVKWWAAPKAVHDEIHDTRADRATQTGFYHIDFMLDNDVKQSLPITGGMQDFRIRYTAGAAGVLDVYVEYLDLWGLNRF